MATEQKRNASDWHNAHGFFVRGTIVFSGAKLINKKDGGQLVIVKHEIALKPGLVVWQEFYDPEKTPEIKILNGEVMGASQFFSKR